jgi:hypothetical protein
MRLLYSFLILFSQLSFCYSQTKLSDLVQRSKPCIIIIKTYDKNGKQIALGTGFFIDSRGTALSNYHVFEGAVTATVTTSDGKIYSVNNVISQSKEMDILKFSISNPIQKIFPSLKLTQTKPIEGENVYVIGNPQGLGFSVSNGIVSSLRYDEKIGQIVQTTTPISHGNSGSPLINMSNEVVGIISFSLIEGQNLNFAISISNLSSLFEVNTLIFPDAPKQPQKLDKGFKRFDWDTYSSTVKTNEELKFKEKVDKHDQKEFSLDYVASIGNIDIDISYNFEFDKLRQIKFCPIICLTKKGITDCKWYYPSDFQVAYSNFVSLQEKIIDLLGDDYVELWWKLNSLTKKTSDILNSDVITKNQIETYNNINLLREKILTADDKFRMFGVVHRWNSEINKSTYEISLFHSDFNVLGLEDAEHKWTCTLSVKPLEE